MQNDVFGMLPTSSPHTLVLPYPRSSKRWVFRTRVTRDKPVTQEEERDRGNLSVSQGILYRTVYLQGLQGNGRCLGYLHFSGVWLIRMYFVGSTTVGISESLWANRGRSRKKEYMRRGIKMGEMKITRRSEVRTKVTTPPTRTDTTLSRCRPPSTMTAKKKTLMPITLRRAWSNPSSWRMPTQLRRIMR